MQRIFSGEADLPRLNRVYADKIGEILERTGNRVDYLYCLDKRKFKTWVMILKYHRDSCHTSQGTSADLYQVKVQYQFRISLSYTSIMTGDIHCEIII